VYQRTIGSRSSRRRGSHLRAGQTRVRLEAFQEAAHIHECSMLVLHLQSRFPSDADLGDGLGRGSEAGLVELSALMNLDVGGPLDT